MRAKSQLHLIRELSDSQAAIRESIIHSMRTTALRLVESFFAEEVESLCGARFSRKGAALCHRGGSDPGSVLLNGQRIKVTKPRLKREGKELALQSYQALQNFDLVSDKVTAAMLHGVSTRNYNALLDDLQGGVGLSKSSVSRAFSRSTEMALNNINGRDLCSYKFLAMLIDGVRFGKAMFIVALGITSDGRKIILGLREGITENSELCKDLLSAIKDRCLNTNELLHILDGSKALRKAVIETYGKEALIQRCTAHKQRNLQEYLREDYHAEFRRRWKRLHGQVNYSDALKEHSALEYWLSKISEPALGSLREAEKETLTVTKLGIPQALRRSLQSTNLIESVFAYVNLKTYRV